MRTPGNFVSAALPSVITHIDNSMKRYPEYLNNDNVNEFLLNTIDKHLTSVGIAMTRGCKIEEKIIDKYVATLTKMISRKYMKECEIIIDSAGFQIQQNYLDRDQIDPFIDLYHDYFLRNHHDKFQYAFNLDLAPGAVDCPFKSYTDMENLNRYSYEKAKALPKEVHDKMIYIHHFRTPRIHEIYKGMLDDGLADTFKSFSTGGLVSFGRNSLPPYIMYMIPLIEILDVALRVGLKKFRFHVLGGSEWKEILGHKFFERQIKELFDVDVQITFDSSTYFKTLCLGRYTFSPDENFKIRKLFLRPDQLHEKNDTSDGMGGRTEEEVFYDLINETVAPYGMKTVDRNTNPIYEDGAMPILIYTYGMFHQLRLFKQVEEFCSLKVDELYPIYKNASDNNCIETESLFNSQIKTIMNLFNGGWVKSDVVETKTISIYNSLEMLKLYKLDPQSALDKCKRLIEQYMYKDECQQLSTVYTSIVNLATEDESFKINNPRTKKDAKRVLRKAKIDHEKLKQRTVRF